MIHLNGKRGFHACKCLLFTVVALFGGGEYALQAEEEIPRVILQYERMLLNSPSSGPAFDKVYQHFFTGDGLERLESRWDAKSKEAGPRALSYVHLLARLAQRRGDIERARELYSGITKENPEQYQVWLALGDLEILEGNLSAGIAALKKALALDVPMADQQHYYMHLARAQQ